MPPSMRMNMNISRLNNTRSPLKTIANQTNIAPVPKKAPVSLSAPMVSRIFNVRPGCGSCGK